MKQQKEVSEIIRQLNMEHDILERNFDKKEKLAIEDRKVRDKLENFKIKFHEQDIELKQHNVRQRELKEYELDTRYFNDLFK
jgi:transposase